MSDIIELIGKALLGKLEQDEQENFGAAVPLNDEAKAAYQEYLKLMKELNDRDDFLHSEHELIQARIAHERKVFIKTFEKLQPDVFSEKGYRFDEKQFTVKARVADLNNPGGVPDSVAAAMIENSDKTVH